MRDYTAHSAGNTMRPLVCWSHPLQGLRPPQVNLVQYPRPCRLYAIGSSYSRPRYLGEIDGSTVSERSWEYTVPPQARLGKDGSWPAPPRMTVSAHSWDVARDRIAALLHPDDRDAVDPVPRYAGWLCFPPILPGLRRRRVARALRGRRPLWRDTKRPGVNRDDHEPIFRIVIEVIRNRNGPA
jgi:hypothetical protein